jgi:predicted HTH transcriptional regulator
MAMLLFGRQRTLHFPDAWVQCGRFIGMDKTDIFDPIELEDSLPQSVESIMLFLKKHAMRGANFSEIQRKDIWSIPLTILREAVINALVHSDYSQRGAPIRIAFYDDRIEIENPLMINHSQAGSRSERSSQKNVDSNLSGSSSSLISKKYLDMRVQKLEYSLI